MERIIFQQTVSPGKGSPLIQLQFPLVYLQLHCSRYMSLSTIAFAPPLGLDERGVDEVAPQTAVPSAKYLQRSALQFLIPVKYVDWFLLFHLSSSGWGQGRSASMQAKPLQFGNQDHQVTIVQGSLNGSLLQHRVDHKVVD